MTISATTTPAAPAVRATLSVKTQGHAFHILIEPQGDPASIAPLCRQACLYAWPLPRFEAGDWAAAFLAAAKPHRLDDHLAGGTGIALCGHWWDQGELDFRYEVTAIEGELVIKTWRRDVTSAAYRLAFAWAGSLEGFFAFAGLEPPAPVPRRYLALFQGPDTELCILAFDGTQADADELEDRLGRAHKLGLLVTGLVVLPQGPIFELGAESIHLALDQLFNEFPPRGTASPAGSSGPPANLPPTPPTSRLQGDMP